MLRNFHLHSKTVFCQFCPNALNKTCHCERGVSLSQPNPSSVRGTPDLFHKHVSQIRALRLHLDCFDKWEHTTTLLPFSFDESFLLAAASELFVHAFVLPQWRGLFIPGCTVDGGLLEQEGKRLSLEAKTPWG